MSTGTSGDDFFGGSIGDDVYSGGDGNDRINDGGGGNDVLNGDGGDDVIIIARFGGSQNNVTVNAGDGNDQVFIDASTGGLFTIDLGAGDDLLSTFRNGTYATDITLGTGVDTIDFNSFIGLTFRDFTPGDAGDIFSFTRIGFRAVNYSSSQNPFATGHLTLTQLGADSVLTFYTFGGASGESLVLGTFQNTLIGNFTAFNFGGFNPAAAGPGEVITGTEGDDTLTGTEAGDMISGLGGNDTIDGGDGVDDIDGGDGADTITGGFGDDTIRGGEGNDVITDAFGANTIDGGGGNDTINISNYFGSFITSEPQRISGGSGNDTVLWSLNSSQRLVLDLGDGDDRINFIFPIRENSLTLGLGSDIVDVNRIQSIDTAVPIRITDFQTGDGGDRLLWSDWIRQETGFTGNPDFNPFSFNETRLVQVGSDVHLIWNFRQVNNSSTLFVFENTQVANFTAFNLEFDPNAAAPPGADFTGTAEDDFFEGTNLDDTARGFGGRDQLRGRAGDDLLDGGDADDALSGDAGNDTLIGGAGNDFISGGSGADMIDGGDGGDEIDAGIGDGARDTINAGSGDDRIIFSGSNDLYIGGAGNDTLEIFGTGFGGLIGEAIIIDFSNLLVDGSFLIGGQRVTDIENVQYFGDPSNFDDTVIYGSNYTFNVNLRGGNGNDRLTGGNVGDSINGGNGNDVLTGLGGDDTIEDLAGDNTINAGDGNDVVNAGTGNDDILGGEGDDTINAGSGNDTIIGGNGNDTINTGLGVDVVVAGGGDDVVLLDGFDPNDDIDGGAGVDTLRIISSIGALDFDFAVLAGAGSASPIRNFERFEFQFTSGNDRLILGPTVLEAATLDGFDGNDAITGGAGNDTIIGGNGSDVLRGGLGNDTIYGRILGFNGVEFDELYGEDGNDSLRGFGLLDGGSGDDFVSGEGELVGGSGNDTINSFGDGDIVRGGTGQNSIALRGLNATVLVAAGLSTDRIDGGSGTYTVRASADNASLQWTAALEQSPTAARAVVTGIDVVSSGGFANFRILGTGLDDDFTLNDFGNSVVLQGVAAIDGLAGNDRITGSSGNDRIFGGQGNDILAGGGGDDEFHGGLGDDRFTVDSAGDRVFENAGEGFDIVTATIDFEIGAHIEQLNLEGSAIRGTGNDQNNRIIGNDRDNALFGRGGSDRIEGGIGNDMLDGGLGNDMLFGGQGNDVLIDFNGFNILDGGDGNDTIQGDGELIGGAGDDQITGGGNRDILVGGTGANRLDGAGGNDTASYRDAFQGVTVDLANSGQQNTIGAGFDTLIAIENLVGSNFNDRLFGNGGANVFTGGGGSDEIRGGANIDIAVFAGNLSNYTVVQFTDLSFGVIGPDGEDRLFGIEFAQFDDQILRLRPGTGVSVNFETNNPAVYQSALNAIRDFDGNALGGNGSWLRIGSADVNGDGDIDQIIVNRALGRFATVGTAPDGLVYFSDHGWAGETRVAGIYIDPFVANGTVAPGSPNDSQRRFQNDLQIENINRVLGANDYDGDGGQEVFFALTDGTAYLRAVMHADGNIRFADYRSQQQVIDYLTANGFGPETYAGWFPSPSSGDAAFDAAQDSSARAALAIEGADITALPGAAGGELAFNPLGFAHSPIMNEYLTAEFYG
jgi:Ca2+-binding RTX toxin-like protein